MKNSKERAIEKLTLKPDKIFKIEQDGFTGALYKPKEDHFPGKVVIMVGGSEGNFPLTRLLAEKYVENGISVLALAYINEPELPDSFNKVPIDPVLKAAEWLNNNGFSKVGIWGISKGAELALITASMFPDEISSVVAVCPINIFCQGFSGKRAIKPLKNSSWSFRGVELPWSKLKFSPFKILAQSSKDRSINLRSCYEKAVKEAEDPIPVENIDGPILLLTPKFDPMWPSEIAARKIIERLELSKFKHPYFNYSYKYASHFLIPLEIDSAKIFKIERKYPEECKESRKEAFEKTLEFWDMYW